MALIQKKEEMEGGEREKKTTAKGKVIMSMRERERERGREPTTNCQHSATQHKKESQALVLPLLRGN